MNASVFGWCQEHGGWAAPLAYCPVCVSRDGELEAERKKNERLRQVLIAGAEELYAHWGAHCGADGYGPVNLARRMEECLAVEYPGYSAGDFKNIKRIKELALKYLNAAATEAEKDELRGLVTKANDG